MQELLQSVSFPEQIPRYFVIALFGTCIKTLISGKHLSITMTNAPQDGLKWDWDGLSLDLFLSRLSNTVICGSGQGGILKSSPKHLSEIFMQEIIPPCADHVVFFRGY